MWKKIKQHWIIALALTFVIGVAAYRLFMMAMFHFYKMPQFPTAVDTAVVKERAWPKQVHSVGTLNASQGITVKSETTGRVTGIYFDSGKYADEGALLIQLYNDDLKADLHSALAQAKLSELEYKRFKLLAKQSATSISSLDTVRAKWEADEANVTKIKAMLAKTLIQAPFSGKLGLKQVEVGDYLNPGDAIVNLQSLDRLRVDFSIPDNYLNELSVGQPVRITSRSYADEVFTGTVNAYESLINPKTRMLAVRAEIDNQNHKLLPGSFVEVSLLLGKPRSVFTIPLTAVVYDEEGNYVYRLADGKASKTLVHLGEIQGEEVAITHGLSKDERVIIAGQLKLADGAPAADRNQPVSKQK